MKKILVVDSDRGMRSTLKERLEYEGYVVETVESGEDAILVMKARDFDLVLCEHRLPDLTGLELLETFHKKHEALPFIMLSAYESVDLAMESIRNGAYDYIPKPIDLNRLLGTIRNLQTDKSQNHATIISSSDGLKKEEEQEPPRNITPSEIIGKSKAVMHLHNLIAKIAPCDVRVLVMGANGTGKELVARSLHFASQRVRGPFVEVNCAAIPSELIESELFGHEKGAFTSAIRQRKGKFEQAHGGTLFLDEIGDMSLSAQAKVLRVLQENRISRVGSDKDIQVDVRVVAATNKDLQEEIRNGTFREDLYHRLSVIVVHIPPLKERLSDIPLLVDHFIEQISRESKMAPKKISNEALDALMRYEWSGNIRELRNVVERLMILGGEEEITREDVKNYAIGVS